MKPSWKEQRVLVTGGTGFIGSFFVERLLQEGARVRVPIRAENYRSLSARRSEIEWMDGDLRDSDYCRTLTDGVDFVFHLASCRRTPKYHEDKCSGVLTENVRMTLSLIEGLREHPEIPVMFLSTANIPPKSDVIDLAKQEHLDGYILGKALSELHWFVASRERGFPLLIVRPVGIYGPRDRFADDGNIIPAIAFKAQKAKDVLTLWGTGKEERTFLYVEDAVQAVFALIEAKAVGVQYLTHASTITLKELAEQIRDIVKPSLPIAFDSSHHVGIRTIPRLPVHKNLRAFPWTEIDEGVKRTMEWWMHSSSRPVARASRTRSNGRPRPFEKPVIGRG